MSSAYAYVDGADLTGLILEIRDEFVRRLPYELDDTRRPNSLRLVALDVFEGKSTGDQVAVMRDLIETDPSFAIARDRDIFEYADTVGAFITDFVCEFVGQVLSRDPSIRAEDDRRSALSAESIEELEEH